MKQGKKYIKEDGSEVYIHEVDTDNKLVSVHIGSDQYNHYHKSEYSNWKEATNEVEELPAEETIETKEVKNKKSKK